MLHLSDIAGWRFSGAGLRSWFAVAMPRGIRDAAPTLEAAQARMVVGMRCILSFSALAIIYVDPSEPARLVQLTYASLALYCLYSAAVALGCYVRRWPAPARSAHWIDVFFYAWLVGLTEGTASIFFYFFFFAILVAAFSYGYREGVRVTAFSALCFAAVSLVYPQADFELNRALLRPVYLFTLGYMITYWGGQEVLLKRRLRLLHDVNNLWSPRFGLEHTLDANLHRLLTFYGADSCVLVLKRPLSGGKATMFVALPDRPANGGHASELTLETGAALLALPRSQAVLYGESGRWMTPARPRCEVLWSGDGAYRCDAQACSRIANILDTRCYVSVPYAQRDGTEGRLYLNASRRLFSHADTDFLLQFAAAIAVVSESLHLMEQLIAEAAEHERYKVSRDLHDSTIQPYIGLKLGLEGLYREIGPGGTVSDRVRDMIEMTDQTINDLRHYADRLRNEPALPGGLLVSAIREQAERYERYYGIRLEVESVIEREITGRLAAEVFQMVVEGMSNVLRHAASKSGFIAVRCEGDTITIKIGNRVQEGASPRPFRPRSIAERTHALGGTMTVHPLQQHHTVIEVIIPV